MKSMVSKKVFLILLLCMVTASFAAEPTALKHISFEDNFGGATYIDDANGDAGDIQCLAGGPVGKYADFTNPTTSGGGDNLALSNSAGDSGTIAMFLNIDQSYNYQNVWDCGGNSWTWEMYNDDNAGRFYTKINDWPGSTMVIGGDFNLGQWFHYAWVWQRDVDNGNVTHSLYIDGELVDTVTDSWTDAGNYFYPGGGNALNYKYNGAMDEVYLFDNALDANQISSFVANSTGEKIATDPQPYIGSDVNSTSTDLEWKAPAGVSSPVYDVYFGTDANLTESDLIVNETTNTNCSPSSTLKSNQTYYWRVDVNDAGTIHTGVVWTFNVVFGTDKPVAVAHASFEDNYGGAEYIDDAEGAYGNIEFVSNAPLGKAGEFTNPEGEVGGDSLSFDAPIGDSGTVSMYVNVDPFDAYPTLWDGSSTGNWWKTYFSGNNIYNRINGDAWSPIVYDFDSTVGTGNWFHYTFTWKQKLTDPTRADTTLYIDGVSVATSVERMDNAGSICLGGGNLSWYQKFNGKIDEFYQFDKALDADQVKALVEDSSNGSLAYDPEPFVGNVSMGSARKLSWKAPPAVNSASYNVYFSTDPVLPDSSRIASGITDTNIEIDVTADQTYYWRVDVIDGGNVREGIVWSFTPRYLDSDLNTDGSVNLEDFVNVAGNWNKNNFSSGSDLVIDDFESYTALPGSPNVLDTWEVVPDNYYSVPVWGDTDLDVTTSAYNGNQALTYSYDFTTVLSEYAISEFMYVFDTPQDLSNYGRFEMWINCHSGNSREQYFYVKLFQGGVGCGGVTGEHRLYPSVYQVGSDAGATTDQTPGWIKVTADLGKYDDLSDIHGLEIGCSTEPYGEDMGSGTIDIDDIRFVFVPKCTDDLEGDINGDCIVNMLDMKDLALEWLK